MPINQTRTLRLKQVASNPHGHKHLADTVRQRLDNSEGIDTETESLTRVLDRMVSGERLWAGNDTT